MDYTTIIFGFYLLFTFTSAITTFLHEMGHAIPALIFTKEKVDIYLGTYGDETKSRKINLSGRLSLYFLLNPLLWRRGMVRHSPGDMQFGKRAIILLLGPLMSLIIASIAVWVSFSFDLHGGFKLFAMVLSCSALVDLRNIYPNSAPIILANGSHTYCDGYQLLKLFKTKRERADYLAACSLYDAQNYHEAIKVFEKVRPEWISPDMLSVILATYSRLKEYEQARVFYSRFINDPYFASNADVLCNCGFIHSQLNNHQEAMDFYNKSISINENHVYSICNRGFTYNVFEQYPEALADFNKVLAINPEFSNGYSNRAFSYIKLGVLDMAFTDISTAIKLDDKNAYAYRNLGIYHLEMGDYSKALEQLHLAFEIDPNTHMIDDYLKIVGDKLK